MSCGGRVIGSGAPRGNRIVVRGEEKRRRNAKEIEK
jgi:hypothetical protein